MKLHLLSLLIAFLQRRCPHIPGLVSADITEGNAIWRHDRTDYEVSYCRICGAVKQGGDWRTVTPDKEWTLQGVRCPRISAK